MLNFIIKSSEKNHVLLIEEEEKKKPVSHFRKQTLKTCRLTFGITPGGQQGHVSLKQKQASKIPSTRRRP